MLPEAGPPGLLLGPHLEGRGSERKGLRGGGGPYNSICVRWWQVSPEPKCQLADSSQAVSFQGWVPLTARL